MRNEKNRTNETVRLTLVHAFDWEYGNKNSSLLKRVANAHRPYLFNRFGYELMDDPEKIYVKKRLYSEVFGSKRLIVYIDHIDCLVLAAFNHAKKFCEDNSIEFIPLHWDESREAFVSIKEIKEKTITEFCYVVE